MSASAEAIAKVVADLREGRVRDVYDVGVAVDDELVRTAVVVDATAIYYDLVDSPKTFDLYKDHRLAPVWPNALICYHNEHGNAVVVHVLSAARDIWLNMEDQKWESDADTHTIDWDRVEWIQWFTVYCGGRAQRNTVPVNTGGPLHMWRAAVYPDGEIADLRWFALSREPDQNERWDMAQLVVLGAINLGNCVNVELMVPNRPRHARRRLERTRVEVSELHVRSISKSYRKSRDGREPLGTVPIHTVRGHFAEYGTEGRGLLFGKHAGRYWIPSHARGNPEHGRVEQSYTVEP